MEVEIINRLGCPDPGSRPEDSIQPEPDWTSVQRTMQVEL